MSRRSHQTSEREETTPSLDIREHSLTVVNWLHGTSKSGKGHRCKTWRVLKSYGSGEKKFGSARCTTQMNLTSTLSNIHKIMTDTMANWGVDGMTDNWVIRGMWEGNNIKWYGGVGMVVLQTKAVVARLWSRPRFKSLLCGSCKIASWSLCVWIHWAYTSHCRSARLTSALVKDAVIHSRWLNSSTKRSCIWHGCGPSVMKSCPEMLSLKASDSSNSSKSIRIVRRHGHVSRYGRIAAAHQTRTDRRDPTSTNRDDWDGEW